MQRGIRKTCQCSYHRLNSKNKDITVHREIPVSKFQSTISVSKLAIKTMSCAITVSELAIETMSYATILCNFYSAECYTSKRGSIYIDTEITRSCTEKSPCVHLNNPIHIFSIVRSSLQDIIGTVIYTKC